MNTGAILEELAKAARKDEIIKEAFRLSRESENPLSEFCKIANSLGYDLGVMDILDEEERFVELLQKGVNGGGATHSVLYGTDDFYAQFFKEIGL